MEGNKIKVNVVDGKISLNGTSSVITTDTLANNGVIHNIDTVLIPADVNLNTLAPASNQVSIPLTPEDTVRTGGFESVSLLALVVNFTLMLIVINTVLSIKFN